MLDLKSFLSENGFNSSSGKKIRSLITTLFNIDESDSSGIFLGLEESIERISAHYITRLDHIDSTDILPKALRPKETNPGTVLQTHVVLSPNTRRFLISSGQLAKLYKSAALKNHQYTWDRGREINSARDVLATADNFMRWKNGEPVDHLHFAGGRYTE